MTRKSRRNQAALPKPKSEPLSKDCQHCQRHQKVSKAEAESKEEKEGGTSATFRKSQCVQLKWEYMIKHLKESPQFRTKTNIYNMAAMLLQMHRSILNPLRPGPGTPSAMFNDLLFQVLHPWQYLVLNLLAHHSKAPKKKGLDWLVHNELTGWRRGDMVLML